MPSNFTPGVYGHEQVTSATRTCAYERTTTTGSDLAVFSQVLIGTDSITNLHKLEQVSSDEGIGTLAENLLEALREHADVNLKIEAARRETRAEKKRMAMAMRQKALGTLGMTVPPSSLCTQVTLFERLLRACLILASVVLCLLDQREGSGGDQDVAFEANGGADRGTRPDLLHLQRGLQVPGTHTVKHLASQISFLHYWPLNRF